MNAATLLPSSASNARKEAEQKHGGGMRQSPNDPADRAGRTPFANARFGGTKEALAKASRWRPASKVEVLVVGGHAGVAYEHVRIVEETVFAGQ